MQKKWEKMLFGTGWMAKNKWVTSFIVIVLVLAGAFLYLDTQTKMGSISATTDELSAINEKLIVALKSVETATENDERADTYYVTATTQYELGNYNSCISNCVNARNYYSLTEQEYRRIKALVKDLDATRLISKLPEASKQLQRTQNLIDWYGKLADAGINVAVANFEACENLESACRLYQQGNRELASQYLEAANEKIKTHDFWAGIFNQYLAEIRTS